MNMWMATRDNGLAATLYGPGTVSALVGPRVGVKVSTRNGLSVRRNDPHDRRARNSRWRFRSISAFPIGATSPRCG